MKTVYLHLRTKGKRIKVIQKDVEPEGGKVFKVTGCKNRTDAILTLERYFQAIDLDDALEDLLDTDPDTYTALKRALRRVEQVTK